ncbi:hypothetical protein E2C01_084071 [Portunus trituberculatus]|uniref:Uncharacterized protein n=1 Tax=Portunus trituberculatus TaxID=210409 RepID=A0A5B7J878_PORTR|nr:hypothetical protein [Portunus trituberculatus]
MLSVCGRRGGAGRGAGAPRYRESRCPGRAAPAGGGTPRPSLITRSSIHCHRGGAGRGGAGGAGD